MEKKIFKVADHYDLKNKGCDPEEVEILCDIFERLMLHHATSALRKGIYAMKDFESAPHLDITDFTLTLERHEHPDGNEWKGVFEAEGRSMEIWGSVEEEESAA